MYWEGISIIFEFNYEIFEKFDWEIVDKLIGVIFKMLRLWKLRLEILEDVNKIGL